jgi:hypothetical protein
MNTELMINNRLLCTFTTLETLDELISGLTKKYSILYNKMFVLHVKSNNEYVVTYNIDQGNATDIPENTILVHRKKEHNVLYTINSLNRLIESLNGGILDTNYKVNWNDYQNCILLTKGAELKRVNTKLFRIIEL